MLFSSPIFLFLFLPVAFTLCLVVGRRLRNLLLVIVSLIFYAWGEPSFIFLLLLSILVNHTFGALINSTLGRQKTGVAQLLLASAVVFDLGVLITFKYIDFIIATFSSFARWAGSTPIPMTSAHTSLPIGISFFTFHALSYVIDVYRRKWPAACWNWPH